MVTMQRHLAHLRQQRLKSVSDNTWTETGITFSTAPATGTQLGTSGAFSAGWTTVDVTSYITGDGSYNFAFSTISSTNITLRLRGAKGATPLTTVPVLFGRARGSKRFGVSDRHFRWRDAYPHGKV